MTGQGGEWDWGVICEIHKETIKNFFIKRRHLIWEKTHHCLLDLCAEQVRKHQILVL